MGGGDSLEWKKFSFFVTRDMDAVATLVHIEYLWTNLDVVDCFFAKLCFVDCR